MFGTRHRAARCGACRPAVCLGQMWCCKMHWLGDACCGCHELRPGANESVTTSQWTVVAGTECNTCLGPKSGKLMSRMRGMFAIRTQGGRLMARVRKPKAEVGVDSHSFGHRLSGWLRRGRCHQALPSLKSAECLVSRVCVLLASLSVFLSRLASTPSARWRRLPSRLRASSCLLREVFPPTH